MSGLAEKQKGLGGAIPYRRGGLSRSRRSQMRESHQGIRGGEERGGEEGLDYVDFKSQGAGIMKKKGVNVPQYQYPCFHHLKGRKDMFRQGK